MLSWEFLIDEAALASVVPDAYAHYRRPIHGALTRFLGGLPDEHQAAILADQACLPVTASPAERLGVLARGCPALHKLGQILARDRRLSPELRGHFQELESLSPSISIEAIETTLTRELGPLARLGVTLDPAPLAEASVAVVVAFRNETGSGPLHGVFKILKPGIEERLEQELCLLGSVGSYLDQRCDEFGLPHLDYQEIFEQIRDKLLLEIRLDLEQEHLARARAFYDDEPRVLVPSLFEHCTPKVTAMERVWGRKVTETGANSPGERRRLAGLVVTALIARPILSRDRQALYHADPHAGNLFQTTDQRLALLDWSLVGTLGERPRQAMAQVMLGAMTLDAGRIVTVLATLSERQGLDRPALDRVVRSALRRIRQGEFPSYHWLMDLLDEAVQKARLRVAADLMLFRKTLHTLEGVLADIGDGDSRIHQVLQGEFLRQLVVEWPGRWLARPHSRAFPTHLSNADLLQFLLSGPLTASRFWLETGRDLLEPGGGSPG